MAAYLHQRRAQLTVIAVGGAINTLYLRTRSSIHDADIFGSMMDTTACMLLDEAMQHAIRQVTTALSTDWFNTEIQMWLSPDLHRQLATFFPSLSVRRLAHPSKKLCVRFWLRNNCAGGTIAAHGRVAPHAQPFFIRWCHPRWPENSLVPSLLPGNRLRKWAQTLLDIHLRSLPTAPSTTAATPTTTTENTIRVVFISGTHSNQPDLPSGDVLIHAGYLTENGSFDELQSQISWLSAQPSRYKIAIAGNHDDLLDEDFLEKYPERKYNDARTRKELDWGDVIYLQDESVTVEFPPDLKQQLSCLDHNGQDHGRSDTGHAIHSVSGSGPSNNNQNQLHLPTQPQQSTQEPTTKPRALKIHGTPQTPQYGISTFQYPPSSSQRTWSNKVPSDTDIQIVHSPPCLHLDIDPSPGANGIGLRHSGDAHLTTEIGRVRPRLIVFGHIHVGYGRENVVLDVVRRGNEAVVVDI
ncbi:uncharacterized protein BDV17DRAFT_296559 [Aspergillus undulatus]|uniref:uncharacterized protein n=1 Tax=Aspergillus undulatus TaxID=1810928 RepID=UPI003CCE20F0